MLRLTNTYNFKFPAQRLLQIIKDFILVKLCIGSKIRLKTALLCLNLSLFQKGELFSVVKLNLQVCLPAYQAICAETESLSLSVLFFKSCSFVSATVLSLSLCRSSHRGLRALWLVQNICLLKFLLYIRFEFMNKILCLSPVCLVERGKFENVGFSEP